MNMGKAIQVLKVFTSFRMLMVSFLGFASGLPLALTSSTLQAWMVTENVDLALIGIFSLVGLPYSFKFLWSPLLDRYHAPFFHRFGKRKGWILLSQLALAVSIFVLSFLSPASMPAQVAACAVALAFFSASQDIVISAYQVEVLTTEELGAGAGVGIMGYRIAMIFSGAFALFLADHFSWQIVYMIMGTTILFCSILTFFAPESTKIQEPKTLREAVVEPFLEYFRRPGALEILIFMIIYKLDVAMTLAMNTPFILSLGFTKTEIAAVSKIFGMIATIVGGLAGGALMTRMSMYKSLLVFGAIQAISGLSFTLLAYLGKSHGMLVTAIFAENFCSGLGNTAFAAFMMSLTNKKFTATQYALLTSFMALSRYIAGAPSGYLAKSFGWEMYFVICTLVGIPGLLLLMTRYKVWASHSNH